MNTYTQANMRAFTIILLLSVGLALLPGTARAATVCAINPGPKASGNGSELVGQSTSLFYGAQKFTVSSSCTVGAVGVGYFYHGTPADTLQTAIWSDSGGSPGRSLATSTDAISPSAGADANRFATTTYAGTLTLNTATTYWIVWARTGAVNASNYWADLGVFPGTSGGSKAGTTAFVWSAYGDAPNMTLYYEVDASAAVPTPAPNPIFNLLLFGSW